MSCRSPVVVQLRTDAAYVAEVQRLGAYYLSAASGHLLHGDFYPGSWLRCAAPDRGLAVIDPEFCFIGPAEFDVGVRLAHAVFGGDSYVLAEAEFMKDYDAPPAFDTGLLRRFAGVEVMHRGRGTPPRYR